MLLIMPWFGLVRIRVRVIVSELGLGLGIRVRVSVSVSVRATIAPLSLLPSRNASSDFFRNTSSGKSWFRMPAERDR